MDINMLETEIKRDFNNAICLIGIIPFMIFIYLLVVKIASFQILVGEIGYIMLVAMLLLMLGIVMARNMIWMVIKRLVDFNHKVIKNNPTKSVISPRFIFFNLIC